MRAYEAARYLAETIGPRWIASEGERRAGDWIESELMRLGYATRRLWFDCPAWEYRATSLVVDGETLEAGAQMFSPACDVEAPLAVVEPDGKGDFSGDASGHIAVFDEAVAGGVVSRGRLARALRDAGAPAAIVVSRLPDTWSTKMVRDPEAGLATVGVSATTGTRLFASTGARARIVIDATPGAGKTSDVIGERGPQGAPVIITGAHYDAAPCSPGARDNAAGVGVLLELAERFAETALPCRLRFCAFSGHEFGGSDATPFGSKSYVATYPEELADVRLMFNLDGFGGGGARPVLAVYGDDALLERVRSIAPADVEVKSATGGGSDHGVFVRAGIDAVWLQGTEGDAYHREAYHSPLDDMRWLGEAGLARAAEVAYQLLHAFGTT